MTLRLALLNLTPPDHSPLAAQMTAAWLTRAATALTMQLSQHVAPHWPGAVGASVRVATLAGLEPGESPFQFVPSLPDQPGDIAFHYDANGLPDAFEAIDTCATLDDVSCAAGHEGCEIPGDPNCDQWVTRSDGRQQAVEVCDPVQARRYGIDLGDGEAPVQVSDFVLPTYFSDHGTGPTTYLELIGQAPRVEPFAIAQGGYALVRNGDGSGETEVFGTMTPARAMRWAKKWHRRQR